MSYAEDDFNILEKAMIGLGLGYGPYATIKRFCFGLLLVNVPLYYFKPRKLFLPDDTPKPWSVLTDDPNAILLPWWSYGFIVGSILSIFT